MRELLPTYDRGLSLGVRIPEDKLPLDLTDFSGSIRSSIESKTGGTLSMNGLASSLLELKPEATKYWIDRLIPIDRNLLTETFDRLPDGWASDIQKNFGIDLLIASRSRLLDLNNPILPRPISQTSVDPPQSSRPDKSSGRHK